MSDSTEIANRLLTIAMNASQESTIEEQSFASVVASTRENFRRNHNRMSSLRGRKKKSIFTAYIVVMKLAHADFFPGKAELTFLKKRGLGLHDEKLVIGRNMSLDMIQESIFQLLRPNIQALLRMCGFKIGRADKSRKIEIIENIINGEDLENRLKQSKLIILPCNDFSKDLPIIEDTSPVSFIINNIRDRRSENSDCLDNNLAVSSSPVSQEVSYTRRTSTRISSQRPLASSTLINEEYLDEDEEDDNTIFTINESDINSGGPVVFPCISGDAEQLHIIILRSNCMNELFKLYEDDQIINKVLNVQFLGEIGIDGGGLTKELFNIFFEKCCEQFFRGEDCIVPYLELNKRNEIDKFIIIGRILQHMLLLTQTIPSKISKITLMLIGNPDRNINSNILLHELFDYVNPYLRKILKKAFKEFSNLTEKEIDIIQDFYQTYRFYERPNCEKLKDQLHIIASEILVEKPNRLILKMRQGVSPECSFDFWRNCDFYTLLDLQKPTSTKIVNCLQTDPHLTNDQSDVFHYFTMYIHCLDKDKLAALVFLITGSFMMPNSITVKFSDTVGLCQRPTFSTCTDTITLPQTYASYDELKRDLNICLHSEEAKEYTSY